jgi:two-component system, LuxR family, sensor kinase FixL
VIVLVVAAAYYVGANIGLILRFPPTTPSVLWPPNSILTATLLLLPTGRWWLVLLAALPAHVAAELPAGWPLPLVMALFVTNCMEAVIAAALMRRFSDDATRFDTLKRAGVFIIAAGLIAPLLSTFADATVVWLAHAESYWHVWVTRLSSNIVTALTLVPAIVTVVTTGPQRIRRASRQRHFESATLALGLFATTFLLFSGRGIEAGPIPGGPVTPMIFLLPFILWAAVRFGPGGTSLALLTIAVVASWVATDGGGAFTGLLAAESVFALQIWLAVVAIPMLCLTALIEERRRVERALAERLRFEELLSRLSGAFVHLASHEMDHAFDHWFAQLGDFLGLTRITLACRSADEQTSTIAYSWTASYGEGTGNTASNVIFPLAAGDRVLGSIAFATPPVAKPWPDELVQRLRVVAEVFGNALARKEAEDALRASEVMKSAILASLTSSVAVLDRHGWIIAVNDSWTREASTSSIALGVGVNYLDACREEMRRNVPFASEILDGVDAVLARTRPGFTVEYTHPSDRERWLAVSVVPLNRAEGGAVMAHTEITERKRAEHDAQQSRQELAHFTRVSAMGELAASLAHELSQPLAGILINAETARRFLDDVPPALGDMREIIADIIADDTRAADVIRRLRDMLRKGDSQRVMLDLNSLVRDVARLVSSDALIRNVMVTVDCCVEPVCVSGDRVQMQQVILNLLLNAMEAVAESPADNRTVLVRTERSAESVRVTVHDTGPGLAENANGVVFEPFYTTKATGMGMGLSIVRSIVRAHDGVVSAANHPHGGAIFQFELPLA